MRRGDGVIIDHPLVFLRNTQSQQHMLDTSINHKIIKEALLIRKVESKFLELFAQGKLNGTVHTCVGQEFSALAFAGQLRKSDFVFSNHRCHGHYLAFTKDYQGLLAELLGKQVGTCGGVGSSQHLCKDNFFSNGIQGGIVPVAAGYALANKLKGNTNVGVVYIGDGTLGEGALYETMNILSKWEIPLVIVCENNFYAQSTPQSVNLAGDIRARAEAFGIQTYKGDTWHPETLMGQAAEAISYTRESQKPAFFLVETYRLNAHSKGDDDRDAAELETYRERDFLIRFEREDPTYYANYQQAIDQKIDSYVDEILDSRELRLDEYYQPAPLPAPHQWRPLEPVKERIVTRLNEFFHETMGEDERTVFLGEDVLSPYGGAFKVAKGLSFDYPERVFSTPISEGAITGISNGLALNGMRPYLEFMFGDFILLGLDQIINHASKFHHMFMHKVTCPVVFRTPMGGRRGYGPTHSQTLDKFLIGIDNVTTLATNCLIDPKRIYQAVHKEPHPVIVIENKADYGRRIGTYCPPNFVMEENGATYATVRVRPINSVPDCTIVVYGGMADPLLRGLEEIFQRGDVIPELLVITKIHPLDLAPILESVQLTKRLFVVEEGSQVGGVGSEILSAVMEQTREPIIARRIASLPVPIPSVKSLEDAVLPNTDRIIADIQQAIHS
jgi:2-oxoisovalerate dehydrogenase E1 component